jgi:hypothetical protein
MKWISRLLVAVVLMLAAGAAIAAAAKEEKIALDKVSGNVLEAAQKAVPGIKLTTEVEVEKDRKKGMVYEFKGTLEGKEYEIEVLADGKVLKIDQEKDDDEDDKDDQDDKDDDD